jgi:hypothetical protein
MISTTQRNRSQAWFPGRYVPVRHVQGVEVLPCAPQRRGGVQVAKTTIHGTAAELRALAVQMLAAAEAVEPTPANRRADGPAEDDDLRAA